MVMYDEIYTEDSNRTGTEEGQKGYPRHSNLSTSLVQAGLCLASHLY